jgi:hypothetical protein
MAQTVIGVLAVLSLLTGLGAGFGYFQGWVDMETFKTVFLLASVAWFILAIVWGSRGTRRKLAH